MTIKGILLFYIVSVALMVDIECEEYNAYVNVNLNLSQIQEEETYRVNQTSVEYFKSMKNRLLSKLFPSVTHFETDEIDNILRIAISIGDPIGGGLPDTEEKLEAFCYKHADRGIQTRDYFRKRYPVHLITQIVVRFGMKGNSDKNDIYCRDSSSRADYIQNAKLVNAKNGELSQIRHEFIYNLTSVIENQSAKNLARICCAHWSFLDGITGVFNGNQEKTFLQDMMDSYSQYSSNYLCFYHSRGSKACAKMDYKKVKPDTVLPKSFVLPVLVAVSQISTISA